MKARFDIGVVDCENISKVVVTSKHNPEQEFTSFVPSEGDKWFVMFVDGSYAVSPDLVRGDDISHAYEQYLDWAAKYRDIKIQENELEDYKDEHGELVCCGFTSDGTPVDPSGVNIYEVQLLRIEF